MTDEGSVFELEGLKIWVVYADHTATLRWTGVSEIENPEVSVGAFLKDLLPSLQNRKVLIDFRKLEYMNSATLQPILKLIRELRTKQIVSELCYDASVEWQHVTFRCIKALLPVRESVTVTNTT